MLNQVVLTGNLGADPEIFYSSEGDPVATFNLAFKSSKKKGSLLDQVRIVQETGRNHRAPPAQGSPHRNCRHP